MAYQFLLFDNDGVLVDTERWYFEATRRALAELDIDLSEPVYQEIMVNGLAAWKLADEQGIPAETIAGQRHKRNVWYQEYLVTRSLEIPGVEATLASLADRYRMAVVTTSKRADFNVIHAERALLKYMAFSLKREDYVNSKPDPEPYLLALRRFGAGPEEALVIEDSERGLRAALAAGIDCAVVENEFTRNHDFTGAKYHLASLAELPDILG
jgi:HAD superfamily hydrolase (TIGR01509 family)